jgi:hypothetical protein
MAKPPTVVMEADTAQILHAFEAYCVGNSSGHHARRRAGQPPMPDVSAMSDVYAPRVVLPDDMGGLEPLTVFHSNSTIPMTLMDLAKVMQRLTKSNDEVTLVTVILMCRFASCSIAVTRHMMHRLYIAALRLSLKAHNDEFYTNAAYAKAAGVSPAEMNRLEIYLAIGLNWNCCVLLNPACGRDGSTDTTRREALLELAEVSLRAVPEVREDSATMADSASVGGGKRASDEVEDSPTVCGASIASDPNTTPSNADVLVSTLTVSQSNMSLHGGNPSYLHQQSGACTPIDQSSVMIADSTMTTIRVQHPAFLSLPSEITHSLTHTHPMAKLPTVVMEADTAQILHAFEAYCVGNSAGHHARRRAGQPPTPDVSAMSDVYAPRVVLPDDMCGLEPLTVFHTGKTMPITLVDLAKVMQRLTKSNDEVTLVTVILMCRFASCSIAVTRHMMHRLYLAALHLSLKAHNDEFYTNAAYAKAAGVSLAEMNRLEIYLAIGLNWNCCVLLNPACGRDGSTDTTRREALLELAEPIPRVPLAPFRDHALLSTTHTESSSRCTQFPRNLPPW